ATVLLTFQRFPKPGGNSVQHECDMERTGTTGLPTRQPSLSQIAILLIRIQMVRWLRNACGRWPASAIVRHNCRASVRSGCISLFPTAYPAAECRHRTDQLKSPFGIGQPARISRRPAEPMTSGIRRVAAIHRALPNLGYNDGHAFQ